MLVFFISAFDSLSKLFTFSSILTERLVTRQTVINSPVKSVNQKKEIGSNFKLHSNKKLRYSYKKKYVFIVMYTTINKNWYKKLFGLILYINFCSKIIQSNHLVKDCSSLTLPYQNYDSLAIIANSSIRPTMMLWCFFKYCRCNYKKKSFGQILQ